MRVLMFGDRNWNDYVAIEKEISRLHQRHGVNLFVFSGGAHGADTEVRKACEKYGVAFAEFPAWWNYYHRSAGPIRNQWMWKFGLPDQGIGFHADIEKSKGSKNMRDLLVKHNIPVKIITGKT